MVVRVRILGIFLGLTATHESQWGNGVQCLDQIKVMACITDRIAKR